MQLLTTDLTIEDFSGKWIFIDNDFLSSLYEDSSFNTLNKILSLTKRGQLIIDPLTRFEFLRSTNIPSLKELKENFLDADEEIFRKAIDIPQTFDLVRENAISISCLYAHKLGKSGKGASPIDLLLAARVAFYSPKSLLITGNRKDFPSLLFDMVGVINGDDGNQTIAYPVLSFNHDKYKIANTNWKKGK